MEIISTLEQLYKIDFDSIDENAFWNTGEKSESLIHKVHVYPAKFPSLIAQKSFEYAKMNNLEIKCVCDVFCGCGTVAVESCRNGYDFFGCDLNPVAVLLSIVKTTKYDPAMITQISENLVSRFNNEPEQSMYGLANERLKYWFIESQYDDLSHLKSIIDTYNMEKKYKDLFLCIFSSILKTTSKWLTSSIKPQIDPKKQIHGVIDAFNKQVGVFVKAIKEEDYLENNTVDIRCMSALDIANVDYCDIIITSPPYVTSYEYADLHQLSSLWLGYASDYTELRKQSIGSQYGVDKETKWKLNTTALKIINGLSDKTKVASISRYYSQMDDVVKMCYKLLRLKGICIFVIGDTEYKDVRIENAKCLAESMIINGFQIHEITKRKVANKFLPSHRDASGKFSSNRNDRKIYSQEYVIIGRKL